MEVLFLPEGRRRWADWMGEKVFYRLFSVARWFVAFH